ncbi:tetratricopeptide repeat protein [Fulvivirga sp. 29W222]|uniref:Tetratricopeptide repeat protein n=1 Tax=Fulvivirga marina TaxID=2494733 RepID=A0A937KE05_9BACT|nr:tetratricopeptide repeat protein [Fulvivirga marina]MBL6446748.1 tetratricopeptide repeat protein [Fulvivirga marina]
MSINRVIALTLVVLCFSRVYASPRIDSLEMELAKAGNDQKLSLLWDLHNATYFTLPTKSLMFLNQLKEQAEQLNSKYWKAKYLYGKSIILIDQKLYGEAIGLSFKSASMFRELGEHQETADNLYNIGKMYSAAHEWDNSLFYFSETLQLYLKEGSSMFLPYTYLAIGRCYVKKGAYDKGYDAYIKAIEIFESRNDVQMLNWSYNLLGILMFEKGDYHEAKEYYNRSISFEGLKNLDRKRAMAINNIGEVLLAENRLKEARQHLNRSLKLKKQLNDADLILSTEITLSKLDQKEHLYDSIINRLIPAINGTHLDDYNENILEVLTLVTNAYENLSETYKQAHVDDIIRFSQMKDDQISYLKDLKENLEILNNKFIIELSVEQYTADEQLSQAGSKLNLAWTIFAITVLLLLLGGIILYLKYRKINAIKIEKTAILENVKRINQEGVDYIKSREPLY